jgi:polysaccharide export outer membrane protein
MTWKKRVALAAGVTVLLPLLATGCAKQRLVKQVNDAAITGQPQSFTDEKSRLLAVRSLDDLDKKSEDYYVGPEDLLEISIFEWELREETKTASFRVSETGYIAMPVISAVFVGGQSVGDIKTRIEKKLKEGGFIQNPRVSVNIKEYRSKKVAVLGSVKDPGVYTLRQNVTTLLDILSLAGGVNDRAGFVAYVIRPGEQQEGDGKEIVPIDLYELMERGDLSLNMVLGNGDVVNVPEAQTYSVIGYVRKPGNFPLKTPTTILEGIAAAGGLTETTASTEGISLKRPLKSGGTVVIPLDIIEIVQGSKPNWYLQPGDVIDVPEDRNRRFTTEMFRFLGNVLSIGYVVNN